VRPALSGLLGTVLVGLVGLVATSVPAAAADGVVPAPGTAWFGPELDWPNDSPEAYDLRLGADASLFATSVIHPLTDESEDLLEDLSATSAGAGAVGVVNVEPADITALTVDDAEELAAAVARVTEQHDSYLLLRFAPEMNGSWKPWGRRPVTYRTTFGELADAVHEATDAAAMVWAPTYGAGYPYAEPINSRAVGDTIAAAELDRRNIPYLDTTGDGEVTIADDPYGPYYPGDEHVDWVGLTILRFGLRPGLDTNTRPKPGELAARLDEQFGYGDERVRESFYDRFARPTRQPFLLETGAVYNPRSAGPSEEAVKTTWLQQVVDAVAERPLFRAVQWLEQEREEDEVEGTVRWQLASDPALASLSRAVLERGSIALGPVPGIGEDPVEPDPADGGTAPGDGATDPDGEADEGAEAAVAVDDGIGAFLSGVLVTLALVLVAGVVALRIRRRRMIPPWLR
jgi:hypothetical protein